MKRFASVSLFVVFSFVASIASAQFADDENGTSSDNVVTGQMEVRCHEFFAVASFPVKLRLDSWGEIVQNNRKSPAVEIRLEPLDAEFLQKEVAPPDFNLRYGTGPWWQFNNYTRMSYTDDERTQIFSGKLKMRPKPIPLNQTAYFRSNGHYLALKPVAVSGLHTTTARKEGQKVRKAFYWDYVTLEWGYLSPAAVEKWRQRKGSEYPIASASENSPITSSDDNADKDTDIFSASKSRAIARK